jgi:hemoglobin
VDRPSIYEASGDDFEERFLACFMAALDDAGIPQDTELRAALSSYIEWSLADVLQYAPADAVVPDRLAIPRWSWDGLVTT